MKMKKWKKALLWVAGSVFVLLCIGYFGMNIAVSYVLKSMAPQLPVSSGQALESVSPVPTATSGTNVIAEQKEASTPGSTQAVSTVNPTESTKGKEATSTSSQVSVTPAVPPQVAATTTPAPTSKSKEQALTYEAQVTTEKTKAVEDSISLKEKAAVSAILLKKLSATELQLFAKMAANGLSVDEKKQAKEMILKKLSEDEYNQLIQIAAKYGLSEGMSYKDSQKQVQSNK
ncbi:hypothetical protein [Paenibacillus sp. N3.4]|uniref:hypothetical protein n=1 Tax=Paenibacillus sp. N3.4 TaxID=2603222 RepID=UPI0011CA2B22|nr:hypothetical protein [Paenibacillus sp. N3.4]TXK77952.1 hypothetical protein FU659_21420 [Paenibacillus sp. N3.4]